MLITGPSNADANSYATIDDLEKFTSIRGTEMPKEGETLLIKAMDYMAGINWYGQRAKPMQPLAWPRQGITFDGFSFPSDVIPAEVIKAQCMLAIEAESGDLLEANRTAAIKSESISGATSTTYAIADGESFKANYPAVMAILRGFAIADGFSINAVAVRA